MGFLGGSVVKKPQCRSCRRHRLDPGSGRSPGGGYWQPTPVFLPGEPHGQRGLAGHSPQSRRAGHD